jgi:hypothetical protein
LLPNPIRGGQGPNWAVDPYDDDDDDDDEEQYSVVCKYEVSRCSNLIP